MGVKDNALRLVSRSLRSPRRPVPSLCWEAARLPLKDQTLLVFNLFCALGRTAVKIVCTSVLEPRLRLTIKDQAPAEIVKQNVARRFAPSCTLHDAGVPRIAALAVHL